MNMIDITGNWRETEVFYPFIRTREPWLEDSKPKSFHQKLTLSPGKYTIRFEYDPFLDKEDGYSIGNAYEQFYGLKINGHTTPLQFDGYSVEEKLFRADGMFEVSGSLSPVNLELQLFNTRVMRSWLICDGQLQQSQRFRAVRPLEQGDCLLVRGIPFLVNKLDNRFYGADFESLVPATDRGSLFPWNDGFRVECGAQDVRTVHFLGMIHSIDIANGSWYSRKGDHGYSHFVGDKAGEIVIEWMEGGMSHIPLIFGFNIWYGRPWDMAWHYFPYNDDYKILNHDKNMFCGNDDCRDIIRDAVMLVDGVRMMGSNSCNARYIFSLDLGGKAVKAFGIKGEESFYGYPLISGITLETVINTEILAGLPEICFEKTATKAIDLDYIGNNSYKAGVERIMRLFYTFKDDYPALSGPEIPEGYFGPDYDFRGAQDAIYAATYLYRNGPENAAYIADSGTECRSSTADKALHHYTMGMGVWIAWASLYGSIRNWFRQYREHAPGELPGCGEAWSRGAGELLRESMAFGYDKFVKSYVDWMDRALFNEANPPHWNRIIGIPAFCTYKTAVGDVEERGNRENDGHGICMWGRYMIWHWLGRPADWNREHWGATEASVEWIQWQLDNDTLRPGVRKDVLFTESECAHESYDIYSSYNCLHGLKLAMRMAEQLGKSDVVIRWKKLYERLRRGILEHLVDDSEAGPIWHTYPGTDWQDHAHKLVHIHLATEGDTYTPLQDYASGDDTNRRLLEISLNTYRYLMKDKNYNCLRMYGYGQGMMTQAALLLDEMEDAEHFLHMLLNHCYLPKLSGWACPEGIIVHPGGEYYLPVNGYRGQDSHVADSTKAVRLLLGIDDNNPGHLRIVPRYPAAWTSMSISGYPILAGGKRQHIGYHLNRNDERQEFKFNLDHPVMNISIRLGPVPEGKAVSTVYFNDRRIPFEELSSGDSRWIWVRELNGTSGCVVVEYKNPMHT